MAVDLHCHTTASDGTLTPSQLVRLAKASGLKGVGITDHDSTNGLEEAVAAGIEHNLVIVPGFELSTELEGKEFHILGYYPDLSSLVLRQELQNLRSNRANRGKEMLQKLASLGLPIQEERLREIVGAGAVGRPHLAQAMLEAGYVKSVRHAFDKYLGRGMPAYVSRYKLTPVEGIQLILACSAVPVLAHPGTVDMDETIPDLAKAGLKGLEVFHPNHSLYQELKYEEMAKRLSLLPTGGSDFHGPKVKENIKLGDRAVPLETVRKLQEFKNY